MRVKFLQDRQTVNYGVVKKNQIINVKKADAEAFVLNGVATKQEENKESN